MFIPSTSDQTDKLFINMLAPIILFIPLLPFEIFFLHDIIWLGIKFKYEKQYLEHNFPNEFFHLTNPNVFSDFAHIEYAVLDKTGTLTESTPKISSLYFNGKFYSLEKSSNILPQTQKKNIIFTESFDKSIEKEISSKLDFENILRKDSNDYNLQFDSDSNFSSLLEQNLNNLAFLTSDCKFINKNLLENDNNHNSKQEDLTSNINKEKLIPYKKGPFINLKEVSGPKIHENNNEKNMNEIPLTNKIIFYNPSNKVLDEEYLKLPDKFDEETLINDAKTSPSKYFTLFEALVLCHYSFPRKDLKTLQTNYTSMDHESETVLRFCESCGFKFENSNRLENPDEYHINLNGVKNMKYRLLGIIDFSITRKIFSLIIQNPNTKQHILIVKGAEAAMCSKIQLTGSDEEKYRMIIKNFSNSGLTPIIYAFKILEEEEAKEFSKRILNLKSSLINQSDQLNELAEELEVNLNLMTILGLKEAMKPDAEELIEFFHSVNIKPWILTGDTKEKSLGAALNLNIITQENEPLMIESIMKEDLVIEIRNILSILKTNSQSYYNPFELEQEFDEKDKKIDKKKKKLINNINYQSSKHFLLINGPSLNLIEKDPYLYPHLAYICSLVKTVIGFNLSPWHKRLITRMIKKKFTRKPLVMAVGDGYNDVLMLQTADVGVEIVKNSNESKYEPVIMAGDIKISRLGQIKEVMTQDSLAHAEVLSDLIYYSGHKSILFGLPIFLFNFYNGFTSAIFQDSVLIFLYFFYFTKPLEIIYGLFYNRFDKKLLKQVPKLYIHGLFVRRKRQQKKLIIGVFLESIFSGILIFYLSIYVAKDSINENGLNNDLNMQALICFYACLIVQSCRMGIKLLRQINKKWGVLLCVGLLIMQAIFLVLEKMENVTGEYVTDNTKEVFSQFPIIMILILIVVLSLFFQMFMQFFFFQKWFPNPYDQVARYMDGRRNINLEKISDFLKEKIKKKMYF